MAPAVADDDNHDKKTGIPAITGSIDYSKAVHIFPASLEPARSTILAYGASLVSTTIGFPMDTVKTRMQTHENFNGYVDCVKKTYVKEGLSGFFRGIWAPLISTSISKSLSVLLFTSVKPYCFNLLHLATRGYEALEKSVLFNIPVCFISGSVAGGGVSLFACPFEFTKVYAQIAKLVQKNSLKDLPTGLNVTELIKGPATTARAVKMIIKHQGLSGLYSGFKLHLLRDSLSSGIYYSIYESVKWNISNLLCSDSKNASPFSICLAGGLSGIFGWALIFPIDTTKSLIQSDVVKNIFRKECGLQPLPPINRKLQKFERKLYRGLGISVTRSFIVNMIFFSVFEFSMALIA